MVGNRFRKPQIDVVLAMTTFALVGFGLIMLSSVSSVISFENSGNPNTFLYKQLISAAIGIAAWVIAQKIDYHFWKKISVPFFLISLLLTIAVFIPGVGFFYNGATRWINLGFTLFQPSEVLKFALIIFLASYFDNNRKDLNSLKKTFVPFIILILFIGGIMLKQPDLGTFLVIGSSAVALYFVAGIRPVYLGGIAGGGVIALIALIKAAPYRMERMLVFLDPEKDPLGIGFHMNQALIAVGSGGFWGRGFGKSGQKYTGYIPEPMGDSVFAIIAEELGFLKVLIAPILLYIVFAWRGFLVASNSTDYFGKLLACGITCWIIFQAVLNISTMTALAPLTGVPLPFISYGGTSLVMILFVSGVLLNVSKHSRQ